MAALAAVARLPAIHINNHNQTNTIPLVQTQLYNHQPLHPSTHNNRNSSIIPSTTTNNNNNTSSNNSTNHYSNINPLIANQRQQLHQEGFSNQSYGITQPLNLMTSLNQRPCSSAHIISAHQGIDDRRLYSATKF